MIRLFAKNLLEGATVSVVPPANPQKPLSRIYDRDKGQLFAGGADAGTWNDRTPAAQNDWTSICWSPARGIFVAVSETGADNRVMTSSDGITWTGRTAADGREWQDICWSPELSIFVAVAKSGDLSRVMTSPDGITWTLRTLPAGGNVDWNGVCWSPEASIFVAVAGSTTSTAAMTSTDGVNWALRTTPISGTNHWAKVRWAAELGLFVAVGDSSAATDQVMTSPDGATWTKRQAAANRDWANVVWSPELRLLVATCLDGTSNQSVMTSPDSVNWTLQNSIADLDWFGLCWAPEAGLFVAIAPTGGVIYSPDGANWTGDAATSNNYKSIAWSPSLGIFAAVSDTVSPNNLVTTSNPMFGQSYNIDVDLGSAKVVSAWAFVKPTVLSTITLKGGDSSPASNTVDSVASASADFLRTFAAVSYRYWRISIATTTPVPTIGEVLLGVPREIEQNPILDSAGRHVLGNVARDRTPTGALRTAKLGPSRTRLAYSWTLLDRTDYEELVAAFHETDEGAKSLLVEDELEELRWMQITSPDLDPRPVQGDEAPGGLSVAVSLVLEESL